MKRSRGISAVWPCLLPVSLALVGPALLQGRPIFEGRSQPISHPNIVRAGRERGDGSYPKAAQEAEDREGEWRAHVDRVEAFFKVGRYKRALPVAAEALRLAETAFGPETDKAMTSLNYLATLYEELGRHAEAEPLYRRALAIRKKLYGPSRSQEELIKDLLGEAEALVFDGHAHALALPRAREALLIAETVYGEQDIHVAEALKILALIYQDQGRSAKAEPLRQRASAIRRKASGSAFMGRH